MQAALVTYNKVADVAIDLSKASSRNDFFEKVQDALDTQKYPPIDPDRYVFKYVF